MPRKPYKWPRGICSHCDREAAVMFGGRINSRHYPCPGAGLPPKALLVTTRVPLTNPPTGGRS